MRGAKNDPESKGNALSCGDAGDGLDKTARKGTASKNGPEGAVKKGCPLFLSIARALLPIATEEQRGI